MIWEDCHGYLWCFPIDWADKDFPSPRTHTVSQVPEMRSASWSYQLAGRHTEHEDWRCRLAVTDREQGCLPLPPFSVKKLGQTPREGRMLIFPNFSSETGNLYKAQVWLSCSCSIHLEGSFSISHSPTLLTPICRPLVPICSWIAFCVDRQC